MTTTTAQAATAPAVTTATLPERLTLRPDMPGVYSGRIFVGLNEQACHFRATVTDDGVIRLEDETEVVAQILLDRARAKVEREECATRTCVGAPSASDRKRGGGKRKKAEVPVGNSLDARKARGEVQMQDTMLAGVTRARALTSLDTLNYRGLLTMRQHEAGDRLRKDRLVIDGAREISDVPADPDCLSANAREDWAVIAARQFEKAREACMALPWFEGVRPWSVVEDVVVNDLPLAKSAGSTNSGVLSRFKTALRMGLDAVATAYGIDDDARFFTVAVDRAPVALVAKIDFDGSTRAGDPKLLHRAVGLNGSRWVAVAETSEALAKLAREEIHRRIVALLGPDVYRDGRAAEGISLDHSWGKALSEERRRSIAGERYAQRRAVDEEAARVLGQRVVEG